MSTENTISIVEVSPRDGLQNEPKPLATAVKVELIQRLAEAGLRRIEASSFVSPKWVPQLADAAEVFQQIQKNPKVMYSALVPNEKGMENALNAGVSEVAVFTAASETFSQKNTNCSIAESLERIARVIEIAKDKKIKVRGYVSCVWGCPFEGDISVEQVQTVSEQLMALGCYEISLGDTIGVGTPNRVRTMIEALKATVPVDQLAVHCHDTYGQAIANIFAAVEEGVRTLDSSVAGLGGCPYAPGASGNVATEDVVYLLQGMGFETGVNLDRLIETGNWISAQLGRVNLSKVAQAKSHA